MKAAVARDNHRRFLIEDVELDVPRDDEVHVRIVGSGVCHSDVLVRDGVFPFPPLPAMLGHEGAGVVERVGASVESIAVGDHVVLSFTSCGQYKGMPGRRSGLL